MPFMDISTKAPTFAGLQLSEATLRSLEAMGYRTPTDVQQEAVPHALAGRDLVVQSRTGTGKTAAFGIPIVEKRARGEDRVSLRRRLDGAAARGHPRRGPGHRGVPRPCARPPAAGDASVRR